MICVRPPAQSARAVSRAEPATGAGRTPESPACLRYHAVTGTAYHLTIRIRRYL